MDIKVLPADDPKNLKLNWVVYEDSGPHILPSDDDSCYNTDEADKYRSNHGINCGKRKNTIWAVIPVLEFLWGQPWNNLALNYVQALRPSSIRVADKGVTADCQTWRVTVWLEKDGRTIKRMEQECEPGSIGARHGHDLQLKLKQQVTGKKIEKFDASVVVINDYALAKINLELDKNAKI